MPEATSNKIDRSLSFSEDCVIVVKLMKKMLPLCFQLISWVPLSLLLRASFILTLPRVMSITEANNIASDISTAIIDIKARGWAMPTPEKPMIIGVLGSIFSGQFVNVENSTKNPYEKVYSGFCIDVFEEVVKTLNYDLPHRFVEFNGSYDDLVIRVSTQNFDAAVGDITILAKRWTVVDFTAPFTEQGVSLVVPTKPQAPNSWLFLKPFTMDLWVATLAMLMYTMFIVWLLVFRSNQEFFSPWKDQLCNVFWFTFSSLFFAQKERIQSNYTRVVLVLWLFVVLILVQSYTASLTSMLTIARLDPNLDSLKKSNALVGCHGTNVARGYLENVLHFKRDNIREDIASQSHYLDAFKRGRISAAFLEVPYAKAFVKQYCNQLMVAGPTYQFGGFGFVFQKGSPIVDDVSAAILRLMEDGTLKKLEDEYFAPSSDCSNFHTVKNNRRLNLQSFCGPYVFYLAISTISLVLFIIHSLKRKLRHRHEVLQEGNITPTTCVILE